MWEELGDRRSRAASLHQLATIEHDQGNPAEAQAPARGDRRVGGAGRPAESRRLPAPAGHHRARAGQPGRGAGFCARRSPCWRSWATARAAPLPCTSWPSSSMRRATRPRRRLWEESIEITKEIRDLDGTATILSMLAQLNALEGRFEEAVAQSREAVRLLEEIGSFKAAWARESLKAIEARAATVADA